MTGVLPRGLGLGTERTGVHLAGVDLDGRLSALASDFGFILTSYSRENCFLLNLGILLYQHGRTIRSPWRRSLSTAHVRVLRTSGRLVARPGPRTARKDLRLLPTDILALIRRLG
jgi:hypothetical protein